MSLFSSVVSVGFCGSRSAAAAPVAAAVAAAAAGGVSSLSVGCAVGADAAALRRALSVFPPVSVSVFSAFGPGGAGAAGRVSAVSAVGAAAAAGCSVVWWAGGGPAVPLRGRLARRSAAFVAALAGSPAPLLVGFPSSPCPAGLAPGARWSSSGSGSWSSLALAAGLAVPVVVVCPAPPPPAWGAWSAVCVAPGVSGWLLRPAAAPLRLPGF